MTASCTSCADRTPVDSGELTLITDGGPDKSRVICAAWRRLVTPDYLPSVRHTTVPRTLRILVIHSRCFALVRLNHRCKGVRAPGEVLSLAQCSSIERRKLHLLDPGERHPGSSATAIRASCRTATASCRATPPLCRSRTAQRGREPPMTRRSPRPATPPRSGWGAAWSPRSHVAGLLVAVRAGQRGRLPLGRPRLRRLRRSES
jgi:hypothetical protein